LVYKLDLKARPKMILSDHGIKEAIKNKDISISPYNEAQLNAASYDLRLGHQVTVYQDWCLGLQSLSQKKNGSDLKPCWMFMDSKKEPQTHTFNIDPDEGFVLLPSISYLMHTEEVIHTDKYVPILDGKSSIGRLFIQVHATAGFGDPGFKGQFTLEVFARHPVIVYPGMRFCQIRFEQLDHEASELYNKRGHYIGTQALGAKASQAWRQFNEK
jgi:dCTP deaminase